MIASIFNTFVDYNDGEKLLYNSFRNSLVKLDKRSHEIYREISSDKYDEIDVSDPGVSSIVAELKEGGFVVDNDMNEADYVRVVDIQSRFSHKKHLKLTISVTADCNFNCTYCYQNNKKPKYMSGETENKIIDYVNERLETDGELSITWYGGEPLLALDTICRLSEAFIKIAGEREARYAAYIITNGYLLSRKVIEKLKQYRITGAQVTVDGVPEYHDRMRRLKNGKGTFDRIMANIRETVKGENGIRISIRINIGKGNCYSFPQFVDKLEEYGIKDKVTLAFTQLEPHEYLCQEINDAALTPEEYCEVYTRIADIAVEREVNHRIIPDRSMSHCSSTMKEGFLIGSDGKLYKCWNVVGIQSECVGEIGKDVKLAEGSLKWLAWDIFQNEMCRGCSILPLCMGGCPRKTIIRDSIVTPMDKCSYMRYNLPELIRILYRQRKRMREKFERSGHA